MKANTGGRVYSLPINLHTINQFFGENFSPKEAQEFIAKRADKSIDNPISFEEQALKYIGKELYGAFFYGYPIKQWGFHPSKLPASILQRLPIRFNYEDNYYNHTFQGIPKTGYTHIVEGILNHKNIKILLGVKFFRSDADKYDFVFYSGPIDGWFDYAFGRLAYRTLKFEEIRADGDIQGCAVMSYPDLSHPYTRIHEHKYFTPWEKHEKTIAFREYSSLCKPDEIPYYPIRLVEEQETLQKYLNEAASVKNVAFIGRLGTYRYLDMDVTIAEALQTADDFLKKTV